MKRLLVTCSLACLVAVASPGVARAAQGEDSITAGLSFDSILLSGGGGRYGCGALATFRRGLRDDWNLYVNVSYAGLFGPGGRSDLGGITIGAGYVLDAVVWVPEIYAGVGVFGSPASGAYKTDLGLEAGLDLDWRRYREFAVGGRAGYRLLVRNLGRVAGEVTVALHVTAFF